MKNKLIAMSIFAAMTLSVIAKAENIPFVVGEPYDQPTYPLDVALTLEYLAHPYPFCYTGDVSDNTETSYDNITWHEFEVPPPEEWCAEREKPTWTQILNANHNAHNVLHQLGAQASGHFSKLQLPLLSSAPCAAIADATTNSPTDAPTNYGVLAAILGADANSTNAKQNTTAANANDAATKLNILIACLEAKGLLTP